MAKKNSPPPLVTKQSLTDMLAAADDAKKVRIVGRALVALFNMQTESERQGDATTNHNGVGFTSCDGRTGSLSAKFFIKHGTLAAWQVKLWTDHTANGFPRICKYSRQLNDIAVERDQMLQARKLQQDPLRQQLADLRYEYGMALDSDDPRILEPLAAAIRKLERELNTKPEWMIGAVA